MGANSTGKEFTVTTFGESHGKIVGVVVDGCPAGLPLTEEDIQVELDRRIPADTKIVSARIEKDTAEFLSGVFNGFTTGAPIALIVENHEVDSASYEATKNLPRPAHADYPAHVRYGGFEDYRGGGRFSGRVTVAVIMAGAIAKKLLATFGVEVLAYTRAVGTVKSDIKFTAQEIRKNRYKATTRCPDLVCAKSMEQVIVDAKAECESVGGVVECIVLNVPAGVGDPLFDSLDAELAKAVFNVPAVKAVEFGLGAAVSELKGSETNDTYIIQDGKVATQTDNMGGIQGGLSNGMPIILRVSIKPTPSIAKEQKTFDMSTMKEATLTVKGRHDPCVVPKAVPAVEAAVAITLADHLIRAGVIPKVLERKSNG